MKNFSYAILLLILFAVGCSQSDSGGGFSFFDETNEAVELVNDANEELRAIRKIQRANGGKLEDLKKSMNERDTARVQQILDELIKAISDGLINGEKAVALVEKATNKKTNETFGKYLQWKEQALRRQVEAFKFRLDTARTLREKFGTEDQNEIEKAKIEFAESQDNFQKLWDVAEELNDRANKLARENPDKIKAK